MRLMSIKMLKMRHRFSNGEAVSENNFEKGRSFKISSNFGLNNIQI